MVTVKGTLLFSVHFISRLIVEPLAVFIYPANTDWVVPQMSGTVLDTE